MSGTHFGSHNSQFTWLLIQLFYSCVVWLWNTGTGSPLQLCIAGEREDNEAALHSVMYAVYALVGHIKTPNCLSVLEAADRDGGLNHSINPHTRFTVQVANVGIQSPTVQLHKRIIHWKLFDMENTIKGMQTDSTLEIQRPMGTQRESSVRTSRARKDKTDLILFLMCAFNSRLLGLWNLYLQIREMHGHCMSNDSFGYSRASEQDFWS